MMLMIGDVRSFAAQIASASRVIVISLYRHRYPKVCLDIDNILTEEDNLICTGAATAVMNLALKIIKREGSARLASACAKALLIDPNRKSQAPYSLYLQLENTLESINEITRRVGYEDDSAFRRLFKRHTSLSPREYRDKFLQVES